MKGRQYFPVGRHLESISSALRPLAADELGHYGGARLYRGQRVLDLGCGDGRLALGCARAARTVVGVDPDPVAIRSARARAKRLGHRNATFRVGAAQALPFADATFDVVILSWTL